MEIKKMLYVLLVGVVLCMIFAGVLKYVNEAGKRENSEKESTTESVVPASNTPEEVPAKEPSMQIAQEQEESILEPVKPVEETMETTEEPTEQPMESVDEPEEKEPLTPVKTAAPTMAPTLQPPQIQEETPEAKDTPQPIKPTEAPKETQVPALQNTPTPIPAKEPAVVEEVHSHEFEKSIWELPTCGKGGYYNNVCKSCGFVECVSLEPLSHETEDIVIQEGNCMEDKVIRHVCKLCGEQTESDTRYPEYDKHQWGSAEVDGVLVEYCEQCGIVK